VEESVVVYIGSYSEIIKETKGESRQSTLQALFEKKPQPGTSLGHYATVKKGQCRDLTVTLTKTFGLGLEPTKVNVQNLIFFIELNLV
jgi:hypothetical protein